LEVGSFLILFTDACERERLGEPETDGQTDKNIKDFSHVQKILRH